MNPLLLTDGYKTGHHQQYPKGTTKVYSNFTPRSNKYAPKGCDKVVSFGQQMSIQMLHDLFKEHFFSKPKHEVCGEMQRELSLYLGTDYDVSHIEALHDLGYLPIKVKIIREGRRVPMRVPVLTIVNTVPEFYWVTNYLETILSNLMWKPMTSATIAYQYRQVLEKWAKKTDPANLAFVDFQGHDFSMRGLDSAEATISSGLGHLTSFLGTDSLPAIHGARKYYGETGFVCASVPATEHSVMCAGGHETEMETFKRLLETYPKGILSVVSDTWDLWKVCTEYLPALKEQILARDGKLVIRPDSGNPVDILCGTDNPIIDNSSYTTKIIGKGKLIRKARKAINVINNFKEESPKLYELANSIIHGKKVKDGVYSSEITDNQLQVYNYFEVKNFEIRAVGEERVREGGWYWFSDESDTYETIYETVENKYQDTTEAQRKGVIELLWDTFGGTINEHGYKVLDPHIGAIYGDSITIDRADEICSRLEAKGFASTNVVLGIGSFTYQYNTRDTFGFAMKATYVEVNGEGREIFKDPITDDGVKKSAKGLLCVTDIDGELVLSDMVDWDHENMGELQLLYEDGVFHNTTTLTEVRELLKPFA